MAQNKNALLRYRTIDRCLRNTGRRWTLQDLVDACSDALYEYEGKKETVSVRTVQFDIQMMRSDRLGYEAPIEVYDRKYYRYSDPDYSISNRPLSEHELELLNRSIELLKQFDEFDRFHEMADIINRLRDYMAYTSRRPIVDFERNTNLKGLEFLSPLYDVIASRTVICVSYQSFQARYPKEFILHPHLLKEYRNRWFLFGSREGDMKIYNLALDRIISFRPLPDITYKDNPEFGEDFFIDVLGVTKHARLKKAKIRFTAFREQADYIITKPLHNSQQLVCPRRADGSMDFEIEVVINYELIKRLLSFGDAIKVVSPVSLAEELVNIYENCVRLYK